MNIEYEERNRPPELLPVQIKRDEAAFLYNVLCDNARPWNADLRKRIKLFVTDSDAFNAKCILQGRVNRHLP